MSCVRYIVLLPLALFAIVACTPNKSLKESLTDEGFLTGIFSNRAQNPTQFIAIVKLKSPALLTTAGIEDGKRKVDAELAKQIEIEQTEAIEDLKKLSPEIKVMFRYKMVLNGLAILAPLSMKDQLRLRMHVAYIERETPFSRPIVQQHSGSAGADIVSKNSVKFIGADKVHNLTSVDSSGSSVSINGAGMKVGIVDTGIDYTHAMFGGAGTEEAFKAVNPSAVDPAFPTAKIVGGIDLVGTVYDSGSGDYSKHIPKPDANPMDEGGHGTHVAGSVAGIGDNVETYSGVAPKAQLYAIKVFGADGSTGDAVVVAALEYSADPNGDGDLKDQLDVVNMSLGSSYGNPHVLYSEAIRNLVDGGTIVVASAGNSGNLDYIVGAPSIVDEAISVAAGVDDSFHNWKFGAIKFATPSAGDKLAEIIEGPVSKPVSEAGMIAGPLVAVGLLDKDLTEAEAALVRGKIALIVRGVVTFQEKMKRAFAAGAIGAIVANNQDSAPISMGGDSSVEIPAVMITKALGLELKEQMKLGDVVVSYQTPEKIEKPELIDTLTGFSSKGPRSIDGFMKPEITGPGSNIISAAMGKGNKGVKFSGTSMSAPHVAGVMALLKQAHPELSTLELKSILMGTAKSIADEKGKNYLLSRQGAGRVQAFESVKATMVADKGGLSLGELSLESRKTVSQSVTVRNIADFDQSLEVALEGDAGLQLLNGQTVNLAAGESKTLVLKFDVTAAPLKEAVSELNAMVNFKNPTGTLVHRIPVLGIAKKVSRVVGKKLTVQATSDASSAGAVTALDLNNPGVNSGLVLPFNFLGQDQRKVDPNNSEYLSKACDLQAVGYRIVNKIEEGKTLKMLQIGVKTFEPMTTWNACEVSVLFDSNGDQVAEQELAAIPLGNLKGFSNGVNDNQFASVLLDAVKVRDLRKQYEIETLLPLPAGKSAPEEDYSEAMVDMKAITPLNNSTVVVVEADVTKLVTAADGNLSLRVATIFNEASSVEMDDYLGNRWIRVSLNEAAQSFQALPESVIVKAGSTETVEFTRGEGKAPLMLLMPNNRTVTSGIATDDQLQILKAGFIK
jgi:minor extracellular serine protease Vpr